MSLVLLLPTTIKKNTFATSQVSILITTNGLDWCYDLSLHPTQGCFTAHLLGKFHQETKGVTAGTERNAELHCLFQVGFCILKQSLNKILETGTGFEPGWYFNHFPGSTVCSSCEPANRTPPRRAAQGSARGTGKCSSCSVACAFMDGKVLSQVFSAEKGLWHGITHPDGCSDAWAV